MGVTLHILTRHDLTHPAMFFVLTKSCSSSNELFFLLADDGSETWIVTDEQVDMIQKENKRTKTNTKRPSCTFLVRQ
jgi:hypothetical protein